MYTIEGITTIYRYTMAIQDVVSHHYQSRVNAAAKALREFIAPPKEGWIRTVRRALGMSGMHLAKKLDVTKGRVSRAERDELRGAVTLKTMHAMAEAMDCRFVYAIVPKESVEDIIWRRALQKARQQVAAVTSHMALEGQALSEEQLRFEEQRVAKDMIAKLPTDFWSDD